jgi:hypothetical protein
MKGVGARFPSPVGEGAPNPPDRPPRGLVNRAPTPEIFPPRNVPDEKVKLHNKD